MIEVGVAHAGKGGYHADPAHKVSSIVVDFITPETETSHWYFWGMARNFNPRDAALTAQIREGQGKIFERRPRDAGAQQQNILRHPERKLLMLNIDAGGVQSRRIIDAWLARERGAAQEAA
jgi:vanillate O-demethylase monooxygenase subunit